MEESKACPMCDGNQCDYPNTAEPCPLCKGSGLARATGRRSGEGTQTRLLDPRTVIDPDGEEREALRAKLHAIESYVRNLGGEETEDGSDMVVGLVEARDPVLDIIADDCLGSVGPWTELAKAKSRITELERILSAERDYHAIEAKRPGFTGEELESLRDCYAEVVEGLPKIPSNLRLQDGSYDPAVRICLEKAHKDCRALLAKLDAYLEGLKGQSE